MTVLIPLPTYGFDPTEAAIPWQYLHTHHVDVVFATPTGTVAAGDKRLLTGKGFGLFKRLLMADEAARSAYQEMNQAQAFKHPISYSEIVSDQYDALLLPGGHDKAIREYLESPVLHQLISTFFEEDRLVGAICHGTITAARSINQQTGESVLADYQTTSLLKVQELSAYYLTCLWLGGYYRTYHQTVADEVRSVLKQPHQQYIHGTHPFTRDTEVNTSNALVTVDRNYISARWPGDAHLFAQIFYDQLMKQNT